MTFLSYFLLDLFEAIFEKTLEKAVTLQVTRWYSKISQFSCLKYFLPRTSELLVLNTPEKCPLKTAEKCIRGCNENEFNCWPSDLKI
tara:strand:+ start:636 stop:896 length:261 start_codon:yes stop_codon:yes gene_type:complete